MKISPEFLRNSWIEMTPHRMIGMPAILGGIFFLTYLVSENSLGLAGNAFRTVGISLFTLLTILWGTKLASECVATEIKDNTWDLQRMTSISPWEMTWGKLFGSTVFVWYGAVFTLAAYLYGVAGNNPAFVIKNILLLVGAGILSQSVAMLASMISIRKNRGYTRSTASASMLLAIIFSASLLGPGLSNETSYEWYGQYYHAIDFILLSVFVFCIWSILGIYRLLRSEFQFANSPLVWILFIFFAAFYSAGFINSAYASDEEILSARLFVAFGISLISAYLLIFSEQKDPMFIRKLTFLAKNSQWKLLIQTIPGWLASIFLATLFGLVLLARDYPGINLLFKGLEMHPYLISAILFAYRDIALVLYFNLDKKRQRADMTAFIYLAILYFLVPGILGKSGLSSIAAFFVPFSGSQIYTSITGAGIQFLIVLVLAYRRWKQNFSIVQEVTSNF
ncbi:MAG TPA: hypothetical protein ENI65_01635 [Gammaproteobacteria bacterium]|nr:hypothetical protein [Gammaproteobacteria bacterium]